MSESARKENQQGGSKKKTVALLFEFENITVNGRKIVYDVCKRLLSEKEIDLTPSLFVRYCLRPSADIFLPELLDVVGKKRLSPSKLAAEIDAEIKKALADNHLKISGGFAKLLEKARRENATIGALTALSQDVTQGLVKKLGLDGTSLHLYYAAAGVVNFPTADAWLKLAKMVGVAPQGCTALATSSESCKAALSGGMSLVALPDDLTSSQDFGGVDLLIDKLNDESIGQVVSLMIQR